MSDTVVAESAGSADKQPAPKQSPLPSAEIPVLIERNRRRGLERIIEWSRWTSILIAALFTNISPGTVHDQAAANLIIGIWAFLNLSMTIAVLTNHYPNRNIQFMWIIIDVAIASLLMYESGGFMSPYAAILFVVVLMGSLRLGLIESIASLLVCSVLYVGVGIAHAHISSRTALVDSSSTILLFIVIAFITHLLARELITSHEKQIQHSFDIEKTALQEIRDIEQAKGEFMMLASHELRTPLTKIKGWLSLMQEAGDRLPQDAREEAMNELRIETEHLARLTDNLLSISQLQTGEIRLKTAAVDIEECFRDVLSRFVESANKQRFRFDLSTDAPRVLADHDRLILALACLVDNALKFSPEDEPIDIVSNRSGRYVRIEITDHGRRIPDSDVERVFASFYQVESPLVRQRGGFGVGLYLSRQLIEHMGGKIGIDNTRGVRGNTFFIQLKAQV